MKKDDYIFYLKKALKGELPPDKVKYYTEYYKSYIDEEVRKGRKQKDIIDELGHPNNIAKSVIEAEKMSGGANYYYEKVEEHKEKSSNTSFKKLKTKLIIGALLFFIILFAIIAFVMKLFMIIFKIFLPVILIVGLISIIRRLIK